MNDVHKRGLKHEWLRGGASNTNGTVILILIIQEIHVEERIVFDDPPGIVMPLAKVGCVKASFSWQHSSEAL